MVLGVPVFIQAASITIDHTRTDITDLSQAEILNAKNKLHIAYGHTSHGSQMTDGMSGLVSFANGHGKGLNLPNNIFAWNNGGTGGALDLHDYAMGGDVGYYPDWVNNTHRISWHGQCGDRPRECQRRRERHRLVVVRAGGRMSRAGDHQTSILNPMKPWKASIRG